MPLPRRALVTASQDGCRKLSVLDVEGIEPPLMMINIMHQACHHADDRARKGSKAVRQCGLP